MECTIMAAGQVMYCLRRHPDLRELRMFHDFVEANREPRTPRHIAVPRGSMTVRRDEIDQTQPLRSRHHRFGCGPGRIRVLAQQRM